MVLSGVMPVISLTTGKVKRDVSVDVVEQPVVQPWVSRQFPLEGDDLNALDPDWKPPAPDLSLGTSTLTNKNSSEQWKIIGTEETVEADRGHLVLKLSKTN